MAAAAEGNGRRTALITGGSGGIGAELARLFARDGWEAGYNAMRAGKSSVVTGAVNRVMAAGTRLLPRGATARLAKMAQARV